MAFAKFWLVSGAVLGGLAVATGAFAAHGLERSLTSMYLANDTRTIAGLEVPAAWKYLQDFKTAADYQMTHALALLAVGLLSQRESRRSLNVAGYCFLLGILLFSGSLYLLVLTGQRFLGMITPIGGMLFLIGWSSLAFAVAKPRPAALVE